MSPPKKETEGAAADTGCQNLVPARLLRHFLNFFQFFQSLLRCEKSQLDLTRQSVYRINPVQSGPGERNMAHPHLTIAPSHL